MRVRRGWSKICYDCAQARKHRLACCFLGLTSESMDPINWVGGKVPRSEKAGWVAGHGDSIIVDVDPETTEPLTMTGETIDTLWLYRGNVGRTLDRS